MRLAIEDQEIEIDVEVRGPERAPTLVFVHGLTTDRRILQEAFEPVFAERTGWRRLYLDLPGHGASPANLASASADGLVATVAAVVREHGGQKPALVGHSYGGYLALGVLGALEREMGVFLAAPILQPDVGLRTLPPRRFSVMEEGLFFGDDELRQAFLAEITVSSAEMLETFARVVDPAHRATDREFLALVRSRYCHSIAWSPAVRGLAGPLHVVCGRDDYWAGFVDALPLVRLARTCRYTVLPGCGHLLPLEAGDAVRALFAAWLDALGGA